MKQRKQKDYTPKPSVNGLMTCERTHRWEVVDLNTEREAVNCPICGGYTSIAKGLEINEGSKR